MKKIDGDAAVWLLRKHSMYAAADLIATMPALQRHKRTKTAIVVDNFLASNADTMELDTSAYKRPNCCYQTYRGYLARTEISDCYCFMDRGRVFLARVHRRADDGKTANIRN